MKRVLLLLLLQVSAIGCFADEYEDPVSNVIYTYDPVGNRAEVKQGREWIDSSAGELEVLDIPGSPDAKTEIVILDRIIVGDKEYIVDKIGDYAFVNMRDIASVAIPSSVKSIGDEAFEGCASLSNIVLSDGLVSIGNGTFGSCKSVTSLSLPEGLYTIGIGAFSGCSSLESVYLPASVTEIDPSSFSDCSVLSKISVASGNPCFDCRGQAQTTYRPFIEEGKVWKYKTTFMQPGIPAFYETFYFDADTIIGEKLCKKLMLAVTWEEMEQDVEQMDLKDTVMFVAPLFEEDQRVWFFPQDKETPILEYDFSAQVGDLIQFQPPQRMGYFGWYSSPQEKTCTIQEIMTVESGSKSFRCLCPEKVTLTWASLLECNVTPFIWIEGVGDPSPNLRSQSGGNLDDMTTSFVGCWVGDEVLMSADDWTNINRTINAEFYEKFYTIIDGMNHLPVYHCTHSSLLYDLSGRRLSTRPAKGLYIENGKVKGR